MTPGVKPEGVKYKSPSRHAVGVSEVVGDETAVEQLADRAHLGGESGGVRDDDQRHLVVAIQFHQQVTQRLGGGVVERAGRLVGKDEAGPIDQRAHDGDTLAFPAGKLAGAMGESMAKTDALEELASAFGGIGGRAAGVGQCGNENIFQHGTLGQQMVRLKNEANLLVANGGEFRLGEVREFFAVQLNATASGGVERAEDVEQGAFAAAGWADDSK